MFNNIGGKIKTLAVISTWLGIISFCIIGLQLLPTEVAYGLALIIGGSLGSWIGSMTLYGFGQLIENTDILVKKLNGNPANFSGYVANCGAPPHSTSKAAPEPWICSECGTKNRGNINSCQGCGVTKAWSDARKS